MNFFVFDQLNASAWLSHLETLQKALEQKDEQKALEAYSKTFHVLCARHANDPLTALAEDLLWEASTLSHLLTGNLSKALKQGASYDLANLITFCQTDWQNRTETLTGETLPSLNNLFGAPDRHETDFISLLKIGDIGAILEYLITFYKQNGTGKYARYRAFRWQEGAFKGLEHPSNVNLDRLVSLDKQLTLLKVNTEVFLREKPAQHCLLYGPRGSGKSTAIKGLLPLYSEGGLRLIELQPADLKDLEDVTESLREQPLKFILFVDDLSFEANDTSYQPLKTLLDGSLSSRPKNVLIYATSNRRHLVREQFSDRPDPLNEDVHRWDTHNERLALSDRFGLTITFPNASQKRYLELVKGLAQAENLTTDNLEAKAISFADWGNGYSGRTAQQFIDYLQTEH